MQINQSNAQVLTVEYPEKTYMICWKKVDIASIFCWSEYRSERLILE